MRFRRIALGVAAIAAIVATVVAGTAFGSGTGKRDVGNNNQTAFAGPKASSTSPEKKNQWAVVESDGTLVRGSKDVISAAHTFTGNYIVTIKKKITGCAFVASTGETGDFLSTDGYATTAIANGTINSVFIRTLDGTAANADYPFHLFIACAP